MTRVMASYTCPGCGQVMSSLDRLRNGDHCPICRSAMGADPVGLPPGSFLQAEKQVAVEMPRAYLDQIQAGDIGFQDRLPGYSPDPGGAQEDDPGNAAHQDTRLDDGKFDREMVALQIVPVKGIEREIEAITQLHNTLASVANPLILEISGTAQRRFLIIRCERRHSEAVRGQITGIYGSPEIIELPAEGDPAALAHNGYEFRAHTRLVQALPAALPIRTYRDLTGNDSILSLLSTLYGLQPDEAGLIQIIVKGQAPHDWSATYRQELLRLRRRRNGEISFVDMLRIISIFLALTSGGAFIFFGNWLSTWWLGLLAFVSAYIGLPVLFRGTDLEWSDTMEEMVARKLEQPGYAVEIRLIAAGADRSRVEDLLRKMIGAFQMFSIEAGNRFTTSDVSVPFNPLYSDVQEDASCILGDTELATLWHLPVNNLPDMMSVKRYDHTMSDPEEFKAVGEDGFLIGHSEKSAGQPVPISIPLSSITKNHAILLGASGMGKSTVLEHMIKAVLKDERRGIVLVDPHGDLVDQVVNVIPDARIADVQYLNFSDPDFIPAINMLDISMYGDDPEITVESFREVAHVLYGKFWGPRMEVPFQRTMMALALANTDRPKNEQFTIIDSYYFLLLKDKARRSFLNKNLPGYHPLAETIRNYFELEFDSLNQAFQQQVVSPVLSKLNPFTESTRLMAIFGQSASSINPMRSVRDGRILLVKTGMGSTSKEFSSFIGSVILNMTERAIMSQENLSSQERRPTTVIVDESQVFAGADFGETLAKVRKFGGTYFLTSQGEAFIGKARSSDELDRPAAFKQVMANVTTRIVFRLAGHDANVLANTEFYNQMEADNLINLPRHHAFIQFDAYGRVHGPTLIKTLPPLAHQADLLSAVLGKRYEYLIALDKAVAVGSNLAQRLVAEFATREASDEQSDGTFPSHPGNPGQKHMEPQAPALPLKPWQKDHIQAAAISGVRLPETRNNGASKKKLAKTMGDIDRHDDRQGSDNPADTYYGNSGGADSD